MTSLFLPAPPQQHRDEHHNHHTTGHCRPPHRKEFSHGVSVTRTLGQRKTLRHVKSVQWFRSAR